MKNFKGLSVFVWLLVAMVLWPSLGLAKDYDGDIAKQRAVVAKEPDNLDAAYTLGTYLSWNGEHDDAIQVFQGILKRDPDHRDADIGLARVLAWSGKQELAIRKFEELVVKYPDYYEPYQGLGSLYLWGNNFEKGIEFFKQALQRKSNDIVSMKGLGRSYLGRGDQTRADYYFTRAQIMEVRRAPLRLALYAALILGGGLGIFFWVRWRSDQRKRELLKMELKLLRYALALHQYKTGKFPLALEALLTEPWLPPGSKDQRPLVVGVRLGDRGVIVDLFGNRYFYNPDLGALHSSTSGCEEW